MDRRELLKMIAILTGGAVVGGEVFLTGCKSGTETTTLSFTPSQISLLDEIGETIIPATNTPGAKAAQVGEFMKVMVTDCYTKAEQDVFIKGIETISDNCQKAKGKTFMDCSPQERNEFLIATEKEAIEYDKEVNKKDNPIREEFKLKGKRHEFIATPKHYYTMMKQLTLLGFFTSKTGMKDTLRHLPVPGKYIGDYEYKKGDKAWAE